ncbi:MAG: hypothetical protein RBT75_15305, partial [Anaerolineae bacterium]|nr:hypothetical protein [Anaerolineae bacterium]
RGCAPYTKITPAKRRRRELIADESRLQDSDLIFSNILSYTLGRRAEYWGKPNPVRQKTKQFCSSVIEYQ